jgi:hypothetical protein
MIQFRKIGSVLVMENNSSLNLYCVIYTYQFSIRIRSVGIRSVTDLRIFKFLSTIFCFEGRELWAKWLTNNSSNVFDTMKCCTIFQIQNIWTCMVSRTLFCHAQAPNFVSLVSSSKMIAIIHNSSSVKFAIFTM